MTPTEEEAELARVIYQATGGEITQGEWDEHVASYRRLCAQWPGYASGAGMVCDAMKRARAILAAGYVKRNDDTDSLPYYPENKPDLKFSITLTPEQAEAFYAAGGRTVVGQTFTAAGDPASIRNDALEEAAKAMEEILAGVEAISTEAEAKQIGAVIGPCITAIRALKAKG